MDDEIEQFLFEKFKQGVDDGDAKPRNPLHNQFKKLERLLESNLRSYPQNQTQTQTQTSQSQSNQNSDNDNPIRDKLYILNNILTESRARTVSKNRIVSNVQRVISNFNTKRSLKKIIQDLERNQNGSQQPAGSANGQNGRSVEFFRWSTPWLDHEVYGFDGELISLQMSLCTIPREANGAPIERSNTQKEADGIQSGASSTQKESKDGGETRFPPFRAFGILGVCGIGKTTLCQKFFNSMEVKDQFVPRIWVCMSKEPHEDQDNTIDLKVTIAERMLLQLGVDKEVIIRTNHDLGALLSLLHQQLLGKRYLIVFDDARDADEWYQNLDSCLVHGKAWADRLAYGLPKGHGGTVIVTGRNEETVKSMVRAENLHRMMPLQDEDSCWNIFKDSATKDGAPFDETNADEFKREIMQKCRGVPLAAKVMGQIMNDHTRIALNGSNVHP